MDLRIAGKTALLMSSTNRGLGFGCAIALAAEGGEGCYQWAQPRPRHPGGIEAWKKCIVRKG